MAKKPTKKAPKGYHYMPNGKLMKDSAMKKTTINNDDNNYYYYD